MSIQRPTKENLDAFIDDARGETPRDQWFEKILNAIATVLLSAPIRYRGYGPYWWLIKRIFVARADLRFGEDVDEDWVAAMTYGDPMYDLSAALLYEDMRFEHTGVTDPDHHLPDDGDGTVFVSQDEDMEAR